jgi:hypothetical protein
LNISIEALNAIKTIKSVGNITVEKNKICCSFVVVEFTEIRDVIIPIFLQYSLLTRKKLAGFASQDLHKLYLLKKKNKQKSST